MAPAHWTILLRESLDQSMRVSADSISYALASSTAAGSSSTRFVVHRGFVNERRPGEPEGWSTNHINGEDGQTLMNDNMLVTTDVRGPKASQIASSPPVSLAWWLLPTKTQFRITANAFIFPPPGHALHAHFPAERLAPSPNFDWEQERLRIWRKMSPDLRASFVRPVPGSKLQEDPASWPTTLPTDLDAKTEEERRLVGEALANFALIVLEPHAVDLCELGVVPNKRTVFTLDSGEWTAESVAP